MNVKGRKPGGRHPGAKPVKKVVGCFGLALTVLVGMPRGFELLAAVAASKAQEFQITIRQNAFDPAELTAKAGEAITLVVTNADSAAEEFESRDLKVEKVIPPGKTVRISIRALKPGTYKFFGEFHPQTAKGRLVVK